jgi:hypothetical protein
MLVMDDVTIIIQGKLEQDSYDFYTKKYDNCNIIISTWVGTSIDFSQLPKNFKVILSPLPKESGDQNINYQIISTLNALEMVTTKYAIKMRGDEYWSFPENIYQSVKSSPEKLWSSSVFFRPWQYAEYHISDHIMAGTTENLLLLFKAAKFNYDNNRLNVSKWKVDGKFHKYVKTHAPEERLTKSYLEAKDPLRFEKIDGKFLMKEHFDILNIDLLKPYKIKANLFKKQWKDDFIPERNFSISTIDQLFSDEPYKIPEK